MPVWTLLVSVVRSREAERRSLLGGYFYIKRMLKSIGAFVFVRSREVVRFWEGPLREAPLYAGRATSRAIMEQMSTVLQAPEGINPDAKFLTAGEILERIQSGIPQQKLHQIFVRTGKGIYLVYLDTTTQHLVYDPPVGTGPDAAANYSTIFVLTPSPQGGAVVFRNYVTSGYAPRLTQTRAQPYAYRIRMEVPYPGAQELKPVYTTFSIQDVSQRQGLVTISVPGQDIYWCPMNEGSFTPGERLVCAKDVMGQFHITNVPSSTNISLPMPELSLGKSQVIDVEDDDS